MIWDEGTNGLYFYDDAALNDEISVESTNRLVTKKYVNRHLPIDAQINRIKSFRECRAID